jgi:hypothetical protein
VFIQSESHRGPVSFSGREPRRCRTDPALPGGGTTPVPRSQNQSTHFPPTLSKKTHHLNTMAVSNSLFAILLLLLNNNVVAFVPSGSTRVSSTGLVAVFVFGRGGTHGVPDLSLTSRGAYGDGVPRCVTDRRNGFRCSPVAARRRSPSTTMKYWCLWAADLMLGSRNLSHLRLTSRCLVRLRRKPL